MTEERRVVTILFSDVVGSTALGEASDPEDLRALMSAYSGIAREVIHARGGTVEKFIGDAVMAVFGVPQTHDDDPDRALGAALALQEAIAREPETSGLTLRIGVNTGEVIAARDGRADLIVTGDPVNVAARLQAAAAPGEILVGDRTVAATRRRFAFGERRELVLKGKSAPIGATALLGQGAAAATDEGPFVGRSADLGQLAFVATRAFDESRPQLVTISAPAGTGKSRLVSEFVRGLYLGRPALRVAVAQSLPYGGGTYLPMRGLLAAVLGVGESVLDEPTIRGALAASGVPNDDAARVAGLVAETLGLAAAATERERDEFFTAWRSLVEALAAREPTVLVIEDLHWATDSLLDLIEHVTQPRTRAPLLMVALTRPELFDRRPTWGTARRNATSITLEPLEPAETTALLRALAPDAPAPAVARMSERAEGNPFFAVELARGLRDRGDDTALPDTVQASVLARLDLLPEEERRALQLGSVVGRTIDPIALAQLIGAPATATLDALAERDLVVPQVDGGYTFRHIVIREVAYGTLPRGDRARAHVAIARWLETLADASPELAAYHYRQALTVAPRSVGTDDVAHAISALERAAAFAKRTGADREAVALLQAAIQFAPAQDQARLHERLGDSLELTDEAADAYAEAFARWSALPDVERTAVDGARLLRKRSLVYLRWGGSVRTPLSGREITEIIGRARSLLALAPDPVEAARLDLVEVFLARPNALTMDLAPEARLGFEEALRRGQAARATLAAAGDINAESEALDALSSIARGIGGYDRSIEWSRERMRLPGLSLLERADAAAMVCWGLALAGDFAGVLDAFAQHIAALRPGEPEGFYAFPHTWAVLAARWAGRWDEALAICDRVATIVETGERSARAPIAAQTLAYGTYIARARLDEARVQRYRAAAMPIAEATRSGSLTAALTGLTFVEDPATASAYFESPYVGTAVGEILAGLLFDHDIAPAEPRLRSVEQSVDDGSTPVVVERLQLVRAAWAGADAMRRAVASLDGTQLVADAARAAGILARMTREPHDRADAERRLRTLGDRAYLARLDEPFEPREA
jgi:class 3 adenylate cyclase